MLKSTIWIVLSIIITGILFTSCSEINPLEDEITASNFTCVAIPDMAFGNVPVSQTAIKEFKITNTGTAVLTGQITTPNGYTLVGTTGNQTSFSIEPEANKIFTVTFKPTSAASYSDSISVTHNASNVSTPYYLPVSGTGINIPLPNFTCVAITDMSFGNVPIGQTSSPKEFKIINTGASILSGEITMPNGYSIVGSKGKATAYSLPAGENKTFSVVFKPVAAINYTDPISISHNANNTANPFHLPVSGVGAPAPNFSCAATTNMSFGLVILGQSATRTFKITNNGTAVLNGEIITPTGYSVVGSKGKGTINYSLAAGTDKTFTVTFTPVTAMSYSDVISITHNATNVSSPYSLPVSGTGLASSAMVLVDGGTYQMGNTTITSATPVHTVTLNSFYIGKYEVTQTEWSATMGENPSFSQGDSKPVEQVSWYDIITYCNKRSIAENLTPCYSISGTVNYSEWGSVPLSDNPTWNAAICNWSANGYRLPTEAEWEFAARGGNSSLGYSYAGSDSVRFVAWCKSNSGNATHAVGGKLPNELGLYDMSGNVTELCWDWSGSYSSNAQTNPTGATSSTKRVHRGGYFASIYDSHCRSAYRFSETPDKRSINLGFRLARGGL